MNSRLTKVQKNQVLSLLGRVKLSLLYKASVHTYSANIFHQKCDKQGPTISVGYNSKGHVFGGYTSRDYDVDMNGEFIHDDKAFLFRLCGNNPVKYPVENASKAIKMQNTSGPSFGESLVLMDNNTAKLIITPETDDYNIIVLQ
ncbi:hypothetical protein DPEC_G00271060 [Dallia pectoralis]|uniref:Uncharacterized protein n=1 Tax=Dallia pectoralis TaxID=75939 RepID=A0ACC2FPJ5_DALPE|nr:hypothetical protein DPEC_G00271060 [Dallia pectoralis]